MFGWFKRRKEQVMDRMLGMAAAGRMATACALLQHFRGQESDESVAIQRAAAVSNWIFQGKLEPQHASLFTPDNAAAIAESWLLLNPDFQELAVQTARVEVTAQFGLSNGPLAEPPPVLIWFGKNHPESPHLDSYPALIARQIQKLPSEGQASLRNWLRREQ